MLSGFKAPGLGFSQHVAVASSWHLLGLGFRVQGFRV